MDSKIFTCALCAMLIAMSAEATITSTFSGAAGGDDVTARAAYRAAVGSYTTEDFSAETSNARVLIAEVENVVGDNHFTVYYTTGGGGNNSSIDIDGTDPDFELGLRTDTTGTDNITLLELRFSSPITAFGAEFRNVDARTQFFNRVVFTIPTQGSFTPADLLDPGNTLSAVSGFVGIITDTPFTVLSIGGHPVGNDLFNMDDIDFRTGSGPEPDIISIDVGAIVTLKVTGGNGSGMTPQFTADIDATPQTWTDIPFFNDVESGGTNTVTFDDLYAVPNLLRVITD